MTPEAIFTGIAVIVSVFSLWFTWRLSVKQEKLQVRLTGEQGGLQQRLTRETEALQSRISQDETVAASRRFFVDLWDKMKGVSEINPKDPVGPDVQTALNLLELIALCYEGNIVDKRMVFLAFGKMYHKLYTQIEQISTPVPGLLGTGVHLLGEAQVISRVHDALQEESKMEGKL